jgi:hypothetical protein
VARKTIVALVDDVDGEEADETVSFALDGATYEIDLSGKNASRLRKELAPFVGSGRRTGGRARRGPTGSAPAPRTSRSSAVSSQQVREWARANGHTLSDRGRIAADVVRAYDAAH